MSRVILPEPDRAILARRDGIVADLRRLVGGQAIIADEVGRRAYETDALTAYRRLPLAVVLPGTTEEIARVLRYCDQWGIKVVARGAGTSLSGGALPTEDAVVIAVSRMNRVLEVDYVNRVARVEVGITNLAISEAVKTAGFFYAWSEFNISTTTSHIGCNGNSARQSGFGHHLCFTGMLFCIEYVMRNFFLLQHAGKQLTYFN